MLDWPRLHAALNDLPIALLVTAVLFDLIALTLKRPAFQHAAFWTLMVGVAGAIVTVVSGLQAEEYVPHGGAVHEVMETHERLGLFSIAMFAVLGLWRIVREHRMGAAERIFMVVTSLGAVVLVFLTAALGGRLVFEHAAGIPDQVLEAELEERTRGHQHGVAAPAADTAAGDTHPHPPGTEPHEH